MNKLASIRQAILAAPLKIADKELLTFAEKGTVKSYRGEVDANKAFEITYTAHLIVTDYSGAPQDLFFVAAEWLHRECVDAAEDAIRFHVDIIDHKKADISLAIDITEIIATPDAGAGLVRLEPSADPDFLKFDMGNFHPDLPASAP